jgi:Fic family protein
VLEEGITIGGKRLIDHFEAIGHSDALDFMYICAKKTSFSENDIKKLHHLFYYRINEAEAGTYRTTKVFITGSKYPLPDPHSISTLMKDFVTQLDDYRSTMHPVEFAARAHKEFVFIHPFIDGNGRVARLLMNTALLQNGYNIAIIPPILRQEYFRTLEKAHVDDTEFIIFIAQVIKETQKDYLRLFEGVSA